MAAQFYQEMGICESLSRQSRFPHDLLPVVVQYRRCQPCFSDGNIHKQLANQTSPSQGGIRPPFDELNMFIRWVTVGEAQATVNVPFSLDRNENSIGRTPASCLTSIQ